MNSSHLYDYLQHYNSLIRQAPQVKNFIAVQFYRPIRVQNYRTRQYQTVFLVFRENIEYQISHGKYH